MASLGTPNPGSVIVGVGHWHNPDQTVELIRACADSLVPGTTGLTAVRRLLSRLAAAADVDGRREDAPLVVPPRTADVDRRDREDAPLVVPPRTADIDREDAPLVVPPRTTDIDREDAPLVVPPRTTGEAAPSSTGTAAQRLQEVVDLLGDGPLTVTDVVALRRTLYGIYTDLRTSRGRP